MYQQFYLLRILHDHRKDLEHELEFSREMLKITKENKELLDSLPRKRKINEISHGDLEHAPDASR